ncbi:MAG: aldehyde dehydrogenase family protein [Streptosporangiaceae bacterium]
MTAQAGLEERAPTFSSLNPATGELVGEFPVNRGPQVRDVVARARGAAEWWGALGWKERRRRLREWRGAIARRAGQLAQLVHVENGKPLADAMLEVALAVEHLEWAAKHAGGVLGRRRVASGLLMMNERAYVDYQPLGVVAVIGPWNYPVFTPMGSIAYALAAGNAVVFKPSEYTPAVGAWLARTFSEAVTDRPVLQTVTGLGDTGADLARAGVDKVAFTGSTATAKKVMATCAESLTPVICECGGKDALVADADADLDAAADAAVWGAMSNAGQTCIGVERVYAVDSVHDELVRKITERAAELRPGEDRTASFGPITMPDQVGVIERHIADALQRGGQAAVGGRAAVRPPYVDPVVLVGVPDDSLALTDETFGPTITVTRVRDVDEAVEKVGTGRYGLGAAVFSRKRGMEIAERLRCGMVSVGSVVSFAAVPSLPFGGVGDSGFGRIHGPDGLREFAHAKAVTRQRFRPPLPLASFRRGERDVKRLETLLHLRFGRR